MKRAVGWGLLSLALIAGLWAWIQRGKDPGKPAYVASPLYTGKEARLKVRISFPSLEKPGFVSESAEIFMTASREARIKQILQHLFAGPKAEGAAAAFPAGFNYREVFVTEKGLAVVDLDANSVALHPGGTSSEFVSLYCLLRSVMDNFKDIKEIQIQVGGETRESLAGHFDISRPLTLEDF